MTENDTPIVASQPRLEGKVAIVTGAGTGLGREIARVYAEAGASVVVGDVLVDEGEETAELISQAGGAGTFVRTDVSDTEQVRELVRVAEELYGALHIVTANAAILGRGHGKGFTELSDDEFARVMDVNFNGVRLSFLHGVPALRRAGGGAMTATTSLSAHRGYANLSAYSASKGAVVALVRALAAELAPDIRVNAVSPGSMRTRMVDHAVDEGAAGRDPSQPVREPFGGIADPRQVAWAHLFLASDHASFVNGQTLIADGGRSIIPA